MKLLTDKQKTDEQKHSAKKITSLTNVINAIYLAVHAIIGRPVAGTDTGKTMYMVNWYYAVVGSCTVR